MQLAKYWHICVARLPMLCVFILFATNIAAADRLDDAYTINVSFRKAGNTYTAVMTNNNIKVTKNNKYNYDKSNATNAWATVQDSRSEPLNHLRLSDNIRLDMPYIFSNDGKLLLAAVHKNTYFLDSTKKIAVIDTSKNKLISMIDLEHYVRSVYFGPCNNKIAVLLAEDVTGKRPASPIDLLAKLVGHDTQYLNLYIYFYDIKGQLLSKRTVDEYVRHGDGYIVSWTRK